MGLLPAACSEPLSGGGQAGWCSTTQAIPRGWIHHGVHSALSWDIQTLPRSRQVGRAQVRVVLSEVANLQRKSLHIFTQSVTHRPLCYPLFARDGTERKVEGAGIAFNEFYIL